MKRFYIIASAVTSVAAIIALIVCIICCLSKKTYTYEVYRHGLELDYYAAKDSLMHMLDDYIYSVAPNSIMNGVAFIDEYEEYGVDLLFAVTQCQIESRFATKGLGGKTNSAFNVKAYDGKADKYMDNYSHPDMSIAPYMKLIVKQYLVNGKTEADLMDNFVNSEGKRYASDPNYERKFVSIYNSLDSGKVGDAYQHYLKYKLLAEM